MNSGLNNLSSKLVDGALRDSIQKWKENTACERHGDMRVGISDCPLCKLFIVSLGVGCTGCPVLEETGQFGCRDTPADELEEHVEICSDCQKGDKCAEARRFAKMEFLFFKSLHPENLDVLK